jgi:hypothetical protein
LYGSLNNDVEKLALASLWVHLEVVAALGADDDLEGAVVVSDKT